MAVPFASPLSFEFVVGFAFAFGFDFTRVFGFPMVVVGFRNRPGVIPVGVQGCTVPVQAPPVCASQLCTVTDAFFADSSVK